MLLSTTTPMPHPPCPQAFLVQPVRAASDMSFALGSQQSGSTSGTVQSPRPGDVMELVEALRSSGVLDTGVQPLASPTLLPLASPASDAGAAGAEYGALAASGAARSAAQQALGGREVHHAASAGVAAAAPGIPGLPVPLPTPHQALDSPTLIPSPMSGGRAVAREVCT